MNGIAQMRLEAQEQTLGNVLIWGRSSSLKVRKQIAGEGALEQQEDRWCQTLPEKALRIRWVWDSDPHKSWGSM